MYSIKCFNQLTNITSTCTQIAINKSRIFQHFVSCQITDTIYYQIYVFMYGPQSLQQSNNFSCLNKCLIPRGVKMPATIKKYKKITPNNFHPQQIPLDIKQKVDVKSHRL